MRLLPKDEKFWVFFNSQTAAFCEATSLLQRAAQDGNGPLAGAAVRIKSIERQSAQTLRELQGRLHKTFVTPIDPEDISLLSEHLDHIFDDLEGISYRLAAYQLQPIPPLVIQLSERMHRCAEKVEMSFGLLSREESIEDIANEILAMTEESNQLVREGVTKLFSETDVMAVVKKKEVYDLYEKLGDSLQDLANALQNVSIKNS